MENTYICSKVVSLTGVAYNLGQSMYETQVDLWSVDLAIFYIIFIF